MDSPLVPRLNGDVRRQIKSINLSVRPMDALLVLLVTERSSGKIDAASRRYRVEWIHEFVSSIRLRYRSHTSRKVSFAYPSRDAV